MTSYSYWRINITQDLGNFGGGNHYANIGYIQFIDDSSGSEISLNPTTGQTASCSGYFANYVPDNSFNNNGLCSLNTNMLYDGTQSICFMELQFPNPVTPTKMRLSGYGGSGIAAGTVEASDDGLTWTKSADFSNWTGGTNTIALASPGPPVPTQNLTASQGNALAAVILSAISLNLSQASLLVAGLRPSQAFNLSQANALVSVRQAAKLQASQGGLLVLARGRTAVPYVQAWTFTLDGHDFYVLRLGDAATMLYDVSTKEWTEWDSFGASAWTVLCGTEWIGGARHANSFGSSILVGDDTFGLLWGLDPKLPYDQDPSGAPVQNEFVREVTGQLPVRGRQAVPCYMVIAMGDNYGFSPTDFAAGVTLNYSDDQGKSFVMADTLPADTNAGGRSYEWLSLGQVEAPGRLFKIVDNGVFARIDSLEMNDDG